MQFFISYSHKDEWLKKELLVAMSGIRRRGEAITWHDRMLKPGEKLGPTIISEIDASDVAIFLLSTDFFDSNYCFEVEFAHVKKRYEDGHIKLAPIVVRQCDWDVDLFPNVVLLPTDAKPVNPPGATPDQPTLRDASWHDVVGGLKKLIADVEASSKVEVKSSVIEIKQNHLDLKARRLQINHPKLTSADIRDIMVGPPLTGSVDGESISSLEDVVNLIEELNAVLIAGDDLHGKTALLFALQQQLCERGIPAVLINGKDIRNRDLVAFAEREISRQLEGEKIKTKQVVLLIDDVDECRLMEHVLRRSIADAEGAFRSVGASAYSPLFGALFEASTAELRVVTLEQLNQTQIYELAERWLLLGEDETEAARLEPQVRHVFKTVSGIVKSGSDSGSVGMVLNLLRLFDSTHGTDVSLTSNAACYDALTSTQLVKASLNNSRIDLAKNFAGFLAIEVWGRTESYIINDELFGDVRRRVESLYFEDLQDIEKALIGAKIISKVDNGYEFASKTMVFFFAGRHLAKYAKDRDPALYELCVDDCVENIKLRSHANTILYCLYFNSDLGAFHQLIGKLDRQFAQVSEWKLDRTTDALMGVEQHTVELIQSSESHRAQRLAVLGEKFKDVAERDTGLAEHYLSPFSEVSVELEEHVDTQDAAAEYLGEMNTLFRVQSVLMSGLRTRSGTFERDTIIKAVDSMVQAAGRFAHLNIFLAARMMTDPDKNLRDIEKMMESEISEIEAPAGSAAYSREHDKLVFEKFDAMIAFFTRWTLVLSQGVLGRLLADGGTIKALELLHATHERSSPADVLPDRQYNYIAPLAVARLWRSGKIDMKFYDELVSAYGKNSRLFQILRLNMFVFSRHMPLDVNVRQWLNDRMEIKIGQIRVKQRGVKALPSGQSSPRKAE